MPSNPNPARAQLASGADFNQRVIPVTRQPQRTWFRVHKSGAPAVLFGRFPHHRFSHPNCPFPLLYVEASIHTCLWEYFGDDVFQGQRVSSAAKWDRCCLSQVLVPELKVCAVSLERTRDAMSVDKASLWSFAWRRVYPLHAAGCESRLHQWLPSSSGVIAEWCPGNDFTGTFTGTCRLWNLQLLGEQPVGVGGGGRNRTTTDAEFLRHRTAFRPRHQSTKLNSAPNTCRIRPFCAFVKHS